MEFTSAGPAVPSKEHVAGAVAFKEGSHIVKHWHSCHAEERDHPKFIFRNLSFYKDCLSRQVAEAILIHYYEYNANCLTRVTVEETKFERKKTERNEE